MSDVTHDLDGDANEAFSLRGAERYTMAEAARIKGVSYHTVSRAVRQGRLPVQRLGRMALIAGQDLDAWQPMRTKAPLRFRGHDPEPFARGAPVAFDDAMGSRLEFARQLSTLYEVIHAASTELSLERFGDLLARRFATVFGLPRVAVWVTHPRDESHRADCVVWPANLADTASSAVPVERVPGLRRWTGSTCHEHPSEDLFADANLAGLGPQGPLLLVPLRARGG